MLIRLTQMSASSGHSVGLEFFEPPLTLVARGPPQPIPIFHHLIRGNQSGRNDVRTVPMNGMEGPNSPPCTDEIDQSTPSDLGNQAIVAGGHTFVQQGPGWPPHLFRRFRFVTCIKGGVWILLDD